MGDVDDQSDDGASVSVAVLGEQERAVDLEDVDGDPAELADAGVPGAKVVQSGPGTVRSQLVQLVTGEVGTLDDAGLGELDDEHPGGDAMGPGGLQDIGYQY